MCPPSCELGLNDGIPNQSFIIFYEIITKASWYYVCFYNSFQMLQNNYFFATFLYKLNCPCS